MATAPQYYPNTAVMLWANHPKFDQRTSKKTSETANTYLSAPLFGSFRYLVIVESVQTILSVTVHLKIDQANRFGRLMLINERGLI